MNKFIAIILASTFLAAPSAYSNEDPSTTKCGFELDVSSKEKRLVIARELALKALSAHPTHFLTKTVKIDGKKIEKMPFNLEEEEEMKTFIDQILQGAGERKAAKNKAVLLKVETSNVTGSDRVVWWENTTETFVVFDPASDDCGTAFRRPDGRQYYLDQAKGG